MPKLNNQQSSYLTEVLQVITVTGVFAVLLLPLVVWNGSYFPFITGKNFLFRIIIELTFVSWALLALYDSAYRPRFSWIVAAFASLLAVMAAANIFSEYPLKSWWSNFERMEGYITLVHLFLYIVVAGSVLATQRLWSAFLHTSIGIAFLVALYGLGQYFGVIDGGRGSRIDSRLGNAAYMAIYMLFHIFFLFYLMLRSKLRWQIIAYAVVAAIMAYTLLQTGTRGTFLGLVGGATATVTYIALFARRSPELRKVAIGGVLFLVLGGLLFMGLRDSQFVQSNGSLKRIANIDLQEDLEVRMTIWGMAYDGFTERPLLGWGQGNFNYVFNKNYDPFLYDQEQWFDRVHNIFFDWLVAGGVLGVIAYFSIFAAVLYYLFIVPVVLRRESPFSVPEQAVLIGLFVAYLLHNMVVFDNIISYIFFASILALIHQRVGVPIPALQRFQLPANIRGQIVVPIVLLLTPWVVFSLNAPGIHTSRDLIDAMREDTVSGRLEAFHTALERDSFARQEVVEQLAQNAMSLARNQQLPPAEKQPMIQRAELELLSLVEDKPGDARLHNFLSAFYRTIGAIEESREQAAIAVSLSPEKPVLKLEQGLIELQEGEMAAAEDFFREAFLLDTRNQQARTFLVSALLRQDKVEEATELLETKTQKVAFAENSYGIASVEAAKAYDLLAELYQYKIESTPDDPQLRASLAFIYYELGNTEAAVEVLESAAAEIPTFADTATCYAENIKDGEEPGAGCE